MSNSGALSIHLFPYFYPYSQADPWTSIQNSRILGKCSLEISNLVQLPILQFKNMRQYGVTENETVE